MNAEVAKRFTEYRKASGLSQGAVAEKLGVSRQAVSKWERGDAVPDVDNFVALAKLYNVSFNTLYFGYDNTPATETVIVEAPAEIPAEAPAEEAAEETVEEIVEETVEEVIEEVAEETEETREESEDENEGGKVKRIIKKIKKIKKTTAENKAVANAIADIPAVALALSALAISGKSKKKLPYVLFAAAIVPVWQATRISIKKSKDAYAKAIAERDAENETSFDEEIVFDEDISFDSNED